MPSILDQLPYPWPDRTAQELHVTLTRLNPTPQAAVSVAEKAGIDIGYLNAQQAPIFVWHDVLDLAAQGGLTRDLVTTARDLLNVKNPRRSFLDALLADEPAAVDTEPRNADGTASFISADDSISEPEALLFQDDLTMEIGRVPALVSTLEALLDLAPAVCRIGVKVGATSGYGTGFRIGPDLVLTNWHVLHVDGARVDATTLEFGYEDDGRGGTKASTAIPGDVASIVADEADDWAVIRPAEAIPDDVRTIALSGAVDPVVAEAAYIVQHPGGDRKRLGFVRNQVSDFDDRVLKYLTDTQQGSSGSPVFDAAGRLIGLHHAGGTPQTVVGRPPMMKNEGIRIPRVIAGLTAAGIAAP